MKRLLEELYGLLVALVALGFAVTALAFWIVGAVHVVGHDLHGWAHWMGASALFLAASFALLKWSESR